MTLDMHDFSRHLIIYGAEHGALSRGAVEGCLGKVVIIFRYMATLKLLMFQWIA